MYVPAHRIGSRHLTYISQDVWSRALLAGCNKDPYINQSRPIDDQQLTCCFDPIGAPNPELSLSALRKDHRLQHFLSAEAWYPKCYKKMPHLGRCTQFSFKLPKTGFSIWIALFLEQDFNYL